MSTDPKEANAAFAARYHFPFPLLSDTTREVCLAYEACDSPNDPVTKRVTYVIGPEMTILQVLEEYDSEELAEKTLAFLRQQELVPAGTLLSYVSSYASTTENEPIDMMAQALESENVSIHEVAPVSLVTAPRQPSEPEVHAAAYHPPSHAVAVPSPVPRLTVVPRSPVGSAAVIPSHIQPAQGDGAPSLVYVIGRLGYDFGTEVRRDAFTHSMGRAANPNDATQMLAHLARRPFDAAGVIWTLNAGGTPIYAIQPAGPFAPFAYEQLRDFLAGQLRTEGQRVAIPGYLGGQVRLLSGQVLPVIGSELRGMTSWSTDALVRAVLSEPPEGAEAQAQYAQQREDIVQFLERVYDEAQNLGLSARERAMNFAVTHAFQATPVFEETVRAHLQLDGMTVEPSLVCRPGSECWDVKLTFFNPARGIPQTKRVYRLTIDVSDVVPVTMGEVRTWAGV